MQQKIYLVIHHMDFGGRLSTPQVKLLYCTTNKAKAEIFVNKRGDDFRCNIITTILDSKNAEVTILESR